MITLQISGDSMDNDLVIVVRPNILITPTLIFETKIYLRLVVLKFRIGSNVFTLKTTIVGQWDMHCLNAACLSICFFWFCLESYLKNRKKKYWDIDRMWYSSQKRSYKWNYNNYFSNTAIFIEVYFIHKRRSKQNKPWWK